MFQKKMNQRIEEITKKLELRQIVVAKFLYLISRPSKYSSKELIRKLGLPQTHLYRLIHEFTDIIEKNSKYIFIKKSMVNEIREMSNKIKFDEKTYDLKRIREVLKKYQKFRPKPNRDLDQFNATIKTTVKRVMKLLNNGDLNDKKVAFLGDDDLVSVAAALTHKCNKITVFEIDKRLNEFINKISKENDLEIEIIEQDLSQPIDKKWLDEYDVVFTDPPYTKEGINLFLNQAIKLIKKNFLGRIYLCYGNSDRAREREVEIQKLILDHNLIIKTKLPQFNKYFGAESIGSQSSLYILDWTPSTKTIESNFKKVYTND